jgi:hypothetical protein
MTPPELYTFVLFFFVLAAQLEYNDQKQLLNIQQQISTQHIEQDIFKLVSFGTCHTLSEKKSHTRGNRCSKVLDKV